MVLFMVSSKTCCLPADNSCPCWVGSGQILKTFREEDEGPVLTTSPGFANVWQYCPLRGV